MCHCLFSRDRRATCSRVILHATIEEEHFLVGTRNHVTLEKMSSLYLTKEFWTSALRLIEEFCSTLLSTVAARSKLRQGVSCFCPEIIPGGDVHSTAFLFGQLLDGLNAYGCKKRSYVEAWKAEFQSFLQEQLQLECHASRKHSDISDVLSYLTHQTGFRSRQRLYWVSSVCHQVDFVAVINKRNIVMSFKFSNRQRCFNVALQRSCPDLSLTLTVSPLVVVPLLLQSYVRSLLLT